MPRQTHSNKYYLALAIVATVSFWLMNYYTFKSKDVYVNNFLISAELDESLVSESKHITKPRYVRGIYLTAYSAGSNSYRQKIIERMKGSRVNSVVIDIKDYSGYILYDSSLAELQKINATKNRMADVADIIQEFHDAGIYVIARQTVFQDPVLARAQPELALKTYNGNTWYDNQGLAWLDPSRKEVWDYNIAIAREATELGFDEINFDYMRYPSDGNTAILNRNVPEGQTKVDVITNFFTYLSQKLTNETYISVDLFGLVMDHTDDDYDLNIGQRLDVALENFDFVSPMMYPSHYPLNYLGFANSAEHPGPVISYGLNLSSSTARALPGMIRPWLQAFNLRAVYTETLIEAQIQATEDFDTTEGWLLWNARNYYPDHIFKK